MISKCPCCGGKLEYQKTIIREQFYSVKPDGTLCKTPSRTGKNKEWSGLESGFVCRTCSFTTIPTQITDDFQRALDKCANSE